MPEEYGIVTELYAYVGFFLVFLTFGMETAYFRYAKDTDGDDFRVYSNLQFIVFALSSLFLVLGFASVVPLSSVLGYSDHKEYILMLVSVIFFDTLSALPFARLRFANKSMRFAKVRLISIFINIFLNLFFIVALPYLIQFISPENTFKPTVFYIFFSIRLPTFFMFVSFLRRCFFRS